MPENISEMSRTTEMNIGRVKYVVNAFFKPDGRETADEKYLKYVTNRVAEEMSREGAMGVKTVNANAVNHALALT